MVQALYRRQCMSQFNDEINDFNSSGSDHYRVFKIFEIVQQTTGGGPNHLSETLVTYSYSMTFNSGDYGYGMSLATFTFLLSLVITGIYSILTRERGE